MLETQNPTIHALNKWPDERRLIIDSGDLKKVKKISIISKQHTLFVADFLKNHLDSFGFLTSVESTFSSEASSDLFLVICPQVFERLLQSFRVHRNKDQERQGLWAPKQNPASSEFLCSQIPFAI
jgi:hypothetical protein